MKQHHYMLQTLLVSLQKHRWDMTRELWTFLLILRFECVWTTLKLSSIVCFFFFRGIRSLCPPQVRRCPYTYVQKEGLLSYTSLLKMNNNYELLRIPTLFTPLFPKMIMWGIIWIDTVHLQRWHYITSVSSQLGFSILFPPLLPNLLPLPHVPLNL